MAATDLYTTAAEFLAAVVAGLELTGAGWDGISYVSPASPAFDCEQVTVHAGGPVEADTVPLSPPLAIGHRIEDVAAVPLLNFTATILRCVHTVDEQGNPPTPDEIAGDAQKVYADVWAVWNHIRTLYRDKLLFTRADNERRELFFDPASPVSTEGGVGGWQIPIRISLEGYRTQAAP